MNENLKKLIIRVIFKNGDRLTFARNSVSAGDTYNYVKKMQVSHCGEYHEIRVFDALGIDTIFYVSP
jgi:hypothetical protein